MSADSFTVSNSLCQDRPNGLAWDKFYIETRGKKDRSEEEWRATYIKHPVAEDEVQTPGGDDGPEEDRDTCRKDGSVG